MSMNILPNNTRAKSCQEGSSSFQFRMIHLNALQTNMKMRFNVRLMHASGGATGS